MSIRAHRIQVRVLPEEHRILLERARACGKAVSTFMREAALGSVPRARPRRLEQETIYQLARIGNNLNQLARAANASRRIELSSRLAQALSELERAVAALS